MHESISPGERPEPIARLLVKAMYLSLDGEEPDAPGGLGEPALQCEDHAGCPSGGTAELVGRQESE